MKLLTSILALALCACLGSTGNETAPLQSHIAAASTATNAAISSGKETKRLIHDANISATRANADLSRADGKETLILRWLERQK